MELPPGPVYLLRFLPTFALPCVIVYSLLKSLKTSFEIYLPPWLFILLVLFAKPVLFIVTSRYQSFSDRRAASRYGAILPPSVPESTISVITKLNKSMANGFPGDAMQQWAEKYGNVVQVGILADSIVLTHEPAHVKAMLATQFESFEKGPNFNSQMDALLGTGIFNADGDQWKFHRSTTRPFFTRERISDFEIYDRNCDQSLVQAQKRLAEGHSIDFQDLVSRFTLDSATEFLFGTNVGSLSAGIPYPPFATKANHASFFNHPSSVFVHAFTEGQIRTASRYSLAAHWPLGADFWSNKVTPMRKIMDNFAEPLLKKALARRELTKINNKAGKQLKGEATNLLDYLINHTQDPSTIKDELVNLLVAGRDTTMCLLTYSFYMLSEHPDVERRLREEIFNVVGQNGSPTYDQIHQMKYMRAFLNEVLRLYPPVPLNTRTSKHAVVWPAKNAGDKPIYIPAGKMCYYSVMNIHRRTDLWGPDAHLFDPMRFLDARLHTYLTPNPFIFCPFNAGPRICLGQQFAYHEATFFLVRLLQRFTSFTLDPSANVAPPAAWRTDPKRAGERVHPMSHLTLYVKGGLWVTMQPLHDDSA